MTLVARVTGLYVWCRPFSSLHYCRYNCIISVIIINMAQNKRRGRIQSIHSILRFWYHHLVCGSNSHFHRIRLARFTYRSFCPRDRCSPNWNFCGTLCVAYQWPGRVAMRNDVDCTRVAICRSRLPSKCGSLQPGETGEEGSAGGARGARTGVWTFVRGLIRADKRGPSPASLQAMSRRPLHRSLLLLAVDSITIRTKRTCHTKMLRGRSQCIPHSETLYLR